MKNLVSILALSLITQISFAETASQKTTLLAQKEPNLSSKVESGQELKKSSVELTTCACEKDLKDNKKLTDLCESCNLKSEKSKMVTEIDYEDGQNHVDLNQDNMEIDAFSDMSDEQLLNFLNQLSQELNLIEKDNDLENNDSENNDQNSFDNLEISKEELQQLLGNLTSIKSNN